VLRADTRTKTRRNKRVSLISMQSSSFAGRGGEGEGEGGNKWGGRGRGGARGGGGGDQPRVQYNNNNNNNKRQNDQSQPKRSQKEQSSSSSGKGGKGSKRTIVPLWKERTAQTHQKHLRQLLESDAKGSEVLLLGDSMCERWLSSGKQLWETEVMGDHRRLRVFNAGVGGDKTQHVLWRLEEKLIGDEFKPQFAIVLIGTNNLEADSAEDIALGIDAIVQVSR